MAISAERKDSSVHDPLAKAIAAERKTSSVSDRFGKGTRSTKKTCIYLAQGRCNRVDCRYLHSEQSDQKTKQFLAPKTKHILSPKTKQLLSNTAKQMLASHMNVNANKRKMTWRNDSVKKATGGEVNGVKRPKSDLVESKKEEVERTSCVNGDTRETLNTWSNGARVTKLAELQGHSKAITGIALPPGSTKLYTMSKDKCVRSWDCQTGQCAGTESLNAELECVITRGPWLFAGLQNSVKAWNLCDKVEFSFDITGGRVHCLEFENDILFAGMEDGSISVWRRYSETNDFKLYATMNGHNGPVNSLVVGSGHCKLYSGSADCSIKVWDQHLQCMQTIHGHTREVTSLLCWDKYLLSASLDMTLKVWGETENGTVEMVYEHKENHGFVSMGGIMNGQDAQHILPCSLVDKSVCLYDFPSFVERGRMLTKEQATVIQVGADGLFFTGDKAGEVLVWKLV